MTRRRLFIAVNLPENVKNNLFKFREKWPELERGTINWVKTQNLHITLAFLGYQADDEMYKICQIMQQIGKRHEPFFVKLERIIAGPPKATPRMFWAEGEKSERLADLQKDLEETIAGRVYFKQENRAYGPHITLARFKYEAAKKVKERGEINELLNIKIPVESIELMQSILKRTGPEYTILESVELGE